MCHLALVWFWKRCTRVLDERRRGALLGGAICLVLFWRFWFIYDALAPCSWRICHWWCSCHLGGDLLHVGDLVHDALVLGGSCSWSFEEILEDDDAVLLWLMTWRSWGDFGGWRCYATLLNDSELWWRFDLVMLWRIGWWRFLCFSSLHSTGKLELATLESWISQTPLGWIQENTSWA